VRNLKASLLVYDTEMQSILSFSDEQLNLCDIPFSLLKSKPDALPWKMVIASQTIAAFALPPVSHQQLTVMVQTA
jgi:hypothetical protein